MEVTREEAERWTHGPVDRWEDIAALARTVVALYDEVERREVGWQSIPAVLAQNTAMRECIDRVRDGGVAVCPIHDGCWFTGHGHEPMTPEQQAVMSCG